MASSETALIQRYFAPLARDFGGSFGLSDDCAALAVEPGYELLATTDAVVEGVHVLAVEEPDAIAWKALAVNISDLVAKGAEPVAYLLALALPGRLDENWLAAFAYGLGQAQAAFRCPLAGGDTDRTPGPLAVTITAFGRVPAGRMVRRSTAAAGDLLYVTGTIGDAALGLKLRRSDAETKAWPLDARQRRDVVGRFSRPAPPLAFGPLLRDYASATIDISDGLIKDCGHLCRASGLGARLDAARIPLSVAARAVLHSGAVSLADLVSGGEDYEVLAAIPPHRAEAFERSAAQSGGRQVSQIGALGAPGGGVVLLDSRGQPLSLPSAGWDHFRES